MTEKYRKPKTAKKPKLPKSIMVIGRRWFDKVNGNTYCSARIYFDGVEVEEARVAFTYGYGDFYVQAAGEKLNKLGKLTLQRYPYGGMESLWSFCSENGIKWSYHHSDVLKRECMAWGKPIEAVEA